MTFLWIFWILLHIERSRTFWLWSLLSKKQTWTLIYISSHIIPVNWENIPYGQFLRIKRNSTDIKHYRQHSSRLAQQFIDRSYPYGIVQEVSDVQKKEFVNPYLLGRRLPHPLDYIGQWSIPHCQETLWTFLRSIGIYCLKSQAVRISPSLDIKRRSHCGTF